MATDQGKTSNVTGLAIMAELTGSDDPRDRHDDLPPALYAGRDRRARRPSSRQGFPADAARRRRTTGRSEQGAVFVEAGPWLRAQYFPQPGESDWLTTVNREVRAVRSGVGVCDVSTLGKIDIQGADAADFLDRVYINTLLDAAGRQGALRR